MKRFYKNLSAWLVCSIALMVLFTALRLPPWITLICIAGWGISIASEAIDVFGFPGIGRDWEEQVIRNEVEKLEMEEYMMERDDEVDDFPETELKLDDDDEILPLKELDKRQRWNDSDLV